MSERLQRPERPLVVLILGGTTTLARSLIQYLLAGNEKRAVFVRLADRFSVNPPSTYLDKQFLALLNSPDAALEYKQVNLANVERHVEVFTPPKKWRGEDMSWEGFDVAYDLTGETAFDKPELLQVSNTYQAALSLAVSASKLPNKPKAYVRLTFPFYEMKSLPTSSAGHTETADLRPDGVRGRWWHETIRGLSKVEGLNTGVIRCGAWYGEGAWEGEVIPRLVVGHVYKYLNEEMKFLHNSDLRIHCIHALDVAQALYLLSLYLLTTPREAAILQAGAPVPFTFTPPPTSTFSIGSSRRSSISDTWTTIKTIVPEDVSANIPLFNVVDEGNSTQENLAKAVAEVWGIQYGFLNSTVATLVQQFAKSDFSEMVEDVNEKHVEAWSDMLAKSDPPIASTPITPFLDEHAFRKHAICLNGTKAKRILGFKPIKPRVEVEDLRLIAKRFQEDGLWPRLSY